MPDFLLIFPWGGNDPSSILFSALVGSEHRDSVAWVCSPGSDHQKIPVSLSPEVDLGFDSVRWGRRVTAGLWRLGVYDAAREATVSRRIDQCVDRLCSVVSRVRPKALWCLAHECHVVIGLRVAERVGLPLHVTVHDEPVDRLWQKSRWPHTSARLVQEAWPRLLRLATSIDVVSEAMADEVRAVSGRGSLVLPPLQRLPLGDSPPPPRAGEVRMGLTSSWYRMPKAHVALHAGRARFDRSQPSEALRVVWVDGEQALNFPELRAAVESTSPDRVDLLPRMTELDAVRRLSDCHVLYLPFWYDNHTMNRTSNPSKLCLYLPTARPIIVHGPDDSVPVRWARQHGLATVWNTLDPNHFPDVLQQALDSGRDWRALRRSYEPFFTGAWSLAAQRERFWRMMASTSLGKQFDSPTEATGAA